MKLFALVLQDSMRSALGNGPAETSPVRLYRGNPWWVYKEPTFSTGCNIRVSEYASGVLRITAPERFDAPGRRLEELFMRNGLAAHGMRELTFAAQELEDWDVIKTLGEFFVRLLRGEQWSMPLFEGEAAFPGYAWTRAGKLALERRKSELAGQRAARAQGGRRSHDE
jgi:hypothetical protein